MSNRELELRKKAFALMLTFKSEYGITFGESYLTRKIIESESIDGFTGFGVVSFGGISSIIIKQVAENATEAQKFLNSIEKEIS